MEPVFSHLTAAAIHGIPVIGSWSATVHVTLEQGLTRRRQVDLLSHSLALDPHEVTRVDGLLVTSRERTLIDLALTTSFPSAVTSLDWALHDGVLRPDLQSELERINPRKRARAAAQAIDFADASSGSPGESLSRAGMHLLGFAIPELQVPVADSGGTIGVVDFYWPGVRLIGEFDGHGKYLRDEFTHGRSASAVVISEKTREDRMRATERGFIRWDWAIASDLDAMGRLLSQAGVPAAY